MGRVKHHKGQNMVKVIDSSSFRDWMVLHGWMLVRETTHLIWRHPALQTMVTTAKTPNDERAWKNNYHIARRLMREAGIASL